MIKDRKKDLAKIHIAKKQLSLSDEDYQAICRRITGRTSARDMDDEQRRAMLTEFRRLGFREQSSLEAHSPKVALANRPLIRKMAAILQDIGRPNWNYARAIGQRMFKVNRLEFCTPEQLRKILQALLMEKKHKEQLNTE